uniref:Uncharacterized protein n=1 Tax=Lepeophtheirus salmonis TaxID=72036 RepID=A0A0K2TP76_LEPSM
MLFQMNTLLRIRIQKYFGILKWHLLLEGTQCSSGCFFRDQAPTSLYLYVFGTHVMRKLFFFSGQDVDITDPHFPWHMTQKLSFCSAQGADLTTPKSQQFVEAFPLWYLKSSCTGKTFFAWECCC